MPCDSAPAAITTSRFLPESDDVLLLPSAIFFLQRVRQRGDYARRLLRRQSVELQSGVGAFAAGVVVVVAPGWSSVAADRGHEGTKRGAFKSFDL